MAPKIAVVYYSMYGHIKALADAQVKGIEAAGGKADVYQVSETLPQEVLGKMGAPPKDSAIPEVTPEILENYDGFLLGIPTRYGNFPAQWKAFWDRCGKQWGAGSYQGKFAGLFISTGTLGGGQESTAIAAMSTLTHLGIIYVPLGYARAPQLLELTEIRVAPHGVPVPSLVLTAAASPARRSWLLPRPRANTSTRPSVGRPLK